MNINPPSPFDTSFVKLKTTKGRLRPSTLKLRRTSQGANLSAKALAKAGFTLVEVTITLALFFLIVYLVFANVSFLNRNVVRAEADKLCNVLRYLQRCAMVSNSNQEIVFDEKNNQYSFEDQTYKLSKKVIFGVSNGVKGPPSLSNKIIKSPITFKGNKLVFTPDGIMSSGTIYLTDEDKNFLYAISVSVAKVSYVRKYLYNHKWILIS